MRITLASAAGRMARPVPCTGRDSRAGQLYAAVTGHARLPPTASRAAHSRGPSRPPSRQPLSHTAHGRRPSQLTTVGLARARSANTPTATRSPLASQTNGARLRAAPSTPPSSVSGPDLHATVTTHRILTAVAPSASRSRRRKDCRPRLQHGLPTAIARGREPAVVESLHACPAASLTLPAGR